MALTWKGTYKEQNGKIRFGDCLWHCYTRKFEAQSFSKGYIPVDKHTIPEEFGNNEVQTL